MPQKVYEWNIHEQIGKSDHIDLNRTCQFTMNPRNTNGIVSIHIADPNLFVVAQNLVIQQYHVL